MALRGLGIILSVAALALGGIGVSQGHWEGLPFALAGGGLLVFLLMKKKLR